MTNKNLELIEIKRFAPVDLDSVIDHCIKYNTLMNLHSNILNETDMWEIVKHLQIARLHFSKAKNMLASMLKPDTNKYIEKAKEAHDWLVNDLGRVEKNISAVEKDFFNATVQLENMILQGRSNGFVRVNSFYNFIQESMDGLVINPLRVAYRNYKIVEKVIPEDTKNKLTLKETKKELFIYWIFLELYHSSLYIGGLTREESPKNVGKGMKIFSSPSVIPSGLDLNEGILNKDITIEESNPFEDEI